MIVPAEQQQLSNTRATAISTIASSNNININRVETTSIATEQRVTGVETVALGCGGIAAGLHKSKDCKPKEGDGCAHVVG